MGQNTKIGHYVLGKTIGQGGFAKVKLATHNITKIQVAVKIINKKKMKNKNMISKVKRQIRILKFINHPNIIKLYEVLDTTSDIFIIMQLANKGQLYENMQTDMSEGQARFYFKQIIDGVQYIHRNHISHRDLKPQNILIDANNVIKIGDFGLSNVMKDGKMLKTPCGSPFYAAPQILSQQKYEGKSVDIWSSGVILYALIVGALPFDDENTTRNNMKIKTGSYKIPQNISPFAKDLIVNMLQVDPRKRITIPQIKSHPWIASQVPIYMKISDQFIIGREEQMDIDEDILSKIKLHEISFHGYTEQKIRKSILKRDDQSFVIAYQLLKSQKDRRLYAQNINLFQQSGYSIFKPINNFQLHHQHYNSIISNSSVVNVPQPPKQFIYGKIYLCGIKQLYDRILKVLQKYAIEYEIKNSQYCIKCYYSNQNNVKNSRSSEMMDEADEKQSNKKEDRFSKNVLKFTVQIFQLNKKNHSHVIDIQLSQGHPLVFFPLSKKIYRDLNP